MISLRTNVSGMFNYKSMHMSNWNIQSTSEKLSSGNRINSAADDPSGLAISSTMKSHYRGISVALENLQDFNIYLESRSRFMNEQMDMAQRVRDLCVRAANDATLTSDDMQKLDDEANRLCDEIERVGRTATITGTSGGDSGRTTLFGPGEVDIVWVMDQTGSMGAHLTALANTGATQMFDALEGKGFDVRMAAVGFGNLANVTTETDALTAPRNGVNDVQFLTAVDSLSDPGEGRVFQDNAADFAADVTSIADASGSVERGIDAIADSARLFGLAPSDTASNVQFREDAQKIFMLITDERSCDNGNAAQNAGVGVPTYLQDEMRAQLISQFGSDVQVWTITNTAGNFGGGVAMDPDYTAVADQTFSLDLVYGGTTWISTVSDQLQGMGGPYDLRIQYGPDAADFQEVTFKTVTATTSGISGVNLTTASNAQRSIDTAQDAIDFISDEQDYTGAWMQRVDNMINDYTKQMINTRSAYSQIMEADMAGQACEMARQQVILNSASSIASQANSTPGVVMDLISTQGLGQNNQLLQTGR